MELSTINVNGVELALRTWGHPTERPAILLLHAGGEDSLSWSHQAEAWAISSIYGEVDVTSDRCLGRRRLLVRT